MMQPPSTSAAAPAASMGEIWARWLGWAWVVGVVVGTLAVLLGWEALAHALDLQSLLG